MSNSRVLQVSPCHPALQVQFPVIWWHVESCKQSQLLLHSWPYQPSGQPVHNQWKRLKRALPHPDNRVTDGQKPYTKSIYTVFHATVLNFSQRKSLLSTSNVEKNWNSSKTLESTGEMKLMIKFYLCLQNFSELLRFIFLGSNGELSLVLPYLGQLFISLAFRLLNKWENLRPQEETPREGGREKSKDIKIWQIMMKKKEQSQWWTAKA